MYIPVLLILCTFSEHLLHLNHLVLSMTQLHCISLRKYARSDPHTLPDYYDNMHTDSVRPRNTCLHWGILRWPDYRILHADSTVPLRHPSSPRRSRNGSPRSLLPPYGFQTHHRHNGLIPFHGSLWYPWYFPSHHMHSDNTSLPAHCRRQAVRVRGYSGYAHQLHLLLR